MDAARANVKRERERNVTQLFTGDNNAADEHSGLLPQPTTEARTFGLRQPTEATARDLVALSVTG